ncbi:MAG: hypothetical protein ACI95C_001917, partial [Pseudohongiellaceae bacterium]
YFGAALISNGARSLARGKTDIKKGYLRQFLHGWEMARLIRSTA